MARLPVLVILGATGTGKSKLGIQLAKKFNGEIISADSMQVYKGLDITSAKVTKEEQSQAKHHMLDVVDPLNEYTVVNFRNQALPIMQNLVNKEIMPIIVGGTNYYIESLLWKILIDDPKTSESDSEGDFSPLKIRRIEETSNEELHNRLKEIDPEMADRLHPNNRRKVIRSLEIFEQHGITHSEILRQQRVAGGSGLGGPLRQENSIILWLTCNKEVLDERLSKRVDSMLEAGLIQELLDFHERYNKDRLKKEELPDYTKGIFQSIGFKEFHKFLILSKEERQSEQGQKLLGEGIELLKIATRQYARRQNKWVKNRLLRRSDRQVPPVYSLDCSDVNVWDSVVYERALEIVEAYRNGHTPSVEPINKNIVDRKVSDSSNDRSRVCEDCDRIFIGDLQWTQHIEGARHKKVLNKKKVKELATSSQ
uniref:U1-type domain-containing protein n=1 Tax=Trichogramma kaykai TaxID=54128 RepID=A0ABD2WEZ9_9HYME